MYYKDNWDETFKHFDAFWNKSYEKRCNLAIRLPRKEPRKTLKELHADSLEQRYMDPEYLYRNAWNNIMGCDYLAEGLPNMFTYFGTAAQCSYFGQEPKFAEDTIWFDPILNEPDASLLKYDESEKVLNKHLDITKYLVDHAGDEFMVGMNDNCGIIDALAELRGPQELLMDLIEEPEFVHECCDKITDVWKKTQQKFFDIIKPCNFGGSSHGWMQLWSPGKTAQIQCDFSVMISPQMYEEFVLPEIEECSNFLDHTTYHLDGMEQIRHLDMILSVKNLDNIQWTHVAGQPKMSCFIKELQRIQAAGKGLVLIPDLDEVEFLMENLSHNGLHLIIEGLKNKEEADDLIRLAEKLAHE